MGNGELQPILFSHSNYSRFSAAVVAVAKCMKFHWSAKFYSILAIFIIGCVPSKNCCGFFNQCTFFCVRAPFRINLVSLWTVYWLCLFHFASTPLQSEMVVICRLLCYRMLLWFLLDFTHSRGKYKSNSLCAVYSVACFWHNKQYYRTLYSKCKNICKWKPIIMTRKLFLFPFVGQHVCSLHSVPLSHSVSRFPKQAAADHRPFNTI